MLERAGRRAVQLPLPSSLRRLSPERAGRRATWRPGRRAVWPDAGGGARGERRRVDGGSRNVRRWMLDAALVQRDGSFHRWLEYRGPQSCLLTLVDDATGRALGQFGAHETIWAAVGVAARVDCPRRDTAGTRHRLEECVCAAAERRGTVDGGRNR